MGMYEEDWMGGVGRRRGKDDGEEPAYQCITCNEATSVVDTTSTVSQILSNT